MKALSVKQPYATAFIDGEKSIEFRSWQTDYRGELLICSSKSGVNIFQAFTNKETQQEFTFPLPKGVTVCVLNLVDCRPMVESDKAEFGAPENIDGVFAWIFDGGYVVEPKPVNGKIKFFEVEDDLIVEMPDDKWWCDYDYPNKDVKLPKDLVGTDGYF